MASIVLARSTAVLQASEATGAALGVGALCRGAGGARRNLRRPVIGPGDRADEDAPDQRQNDQQAGEQQPAAGGPPLGRRRWLRRGLGVFALLLEARDVTLKRLKLAVEILLLRREMEVVWL